MTTLQTSMNNTTSNSFKNNAVHNCCLAVLMSVCVECSAFLSFFLSHFVVTNANKAVFQHSKCSYRITVGFKNNHTDKPKVTTLTNTILKLKSHRQFTILPSSMYCMLNRKHPETSDFKQQLRAVTFK